MVWQTSHGKAVLRTANLEGAFTFDQPSRGLQRFTFLPSNVAIARVFGARISDEVAAATPLEAFARQSDLVVRYPPRAGDQVSHEIYYRALDQPVGIEMLLSTQTSLLESHPMTEVASSGFGPGELLVKLSAPDEHQTVVGQWRSMTAPEYFLFRPTNAPVSVVCYVQPGGAYDVSAMVDGDTALTFRVFPETLEKGVIRRVRFQLREVPRVRDTEHASDVYRRSAHQAPPLTA